MDATLTHVRLLVADYERCFRFYRDDLGLTPSFGDAASGYADFETGDVSLALFAADEMAAAFDGDGDDDASAARGRDAATLVLRVPDVDAAWTDLADADCERVRAPRDRAEWGIRVAHVRDPDGNLLEVNEPIGG